MQTIVLMFLLPLSSTLDPATLKFLHHGVGIVRISCCTKPNSGVTALAIVYVVPNVTNSCSGSAGAAHSIETFLDAVALQWGLWTRNQCLVHELRPKWRGNARLRWVNTENWRARWWQWTWSGDRRRAILFKVIKSFIPFYFILVISAVGNSVSFTFCWLSSPSQTLEKGVLLSLIKLRWPKNTWYNF